MNKDYKYKYMLIPCDDITLSKQLLNKAINNRIDNLVLDLHKASCGNKTVDIEMVQSLSTEICELMKQRNSIITLGSNDIYGAPCFEYDTKLMLLD